MKAEMPIKKRSTLSLAWPTSCVDSEFIEMLPLPEDRRKRISLEHHLQLVVLHAGVGSLMALQLMMRVALTSLFLQRLGYGCALPRPVDDYEAMAKRALDSGAEGIYRFDDTTFRVFAGLVNHLDAQLDVAPWKALSHVADKLEQYKRVA